MSNFQQSTIIGERRKERRASAIGLVSEIEGEFLGISLDLTYEGIRFLVSKDFAYSEPFFCKFRPVEGETESEFTLKVQLKWRKNRNSSYDEIGAEILSVDKENEWGELVEWHINNQLSIKDLSFNSARNISISYAIQ